MTIPLSSLLPRRLRHHWWLRRDAIPWPLWRELREAVPLIGRLDERRSAELRALTTLFLHEKRFSGAHGFEVTDEMRLVVASQACLLILAVESGPPVRRLRWFDGWVEIILYPDSFVTRHEERDDHGLVHTGSRILSGEAWLNGPVLLSWAEAMPGRQPYGEGTNVILHEFAHKLDMQNGVANGMPPLPSRMDRIRWSAAFNAAYADFRRRLENGDPLPLDPYAGESPAEFFAVCTECFFEAPALLCESYLEIYHQLGLFFGQRRECTPVVKKNTRVQQEGGARPRNQEMWM